MRTTDERLRSLIAGLVMVFLMMPVAGAAAARPPADDIQQAQAAPLPQSQTQAADTNAGPVEGVTQGEAKLPENPAPLSSQAPEQSAQSNTPQKGSDQQQNGSQKPLGTAAAPYEKTTGVAASRPAGAAIAPAKQRRARAIVIRVGIVVGAAVAIGTVAGLSKASPSRPQ